MQTLRHKKEILKSFFSEHRQLFFLTLAVSFISGLLTIAVPVAIGKYYDFLFGFHSFRARLLDFLPFDLNNMQVFLAFFFGLVIVKMLFSFLEKYCTGLAGERFVHQLRNLLFRHQMKIPVRDYEDKGAGRYLLRFSGDMNSMKRYLTRGVIRFISDAFLIGLSVLLLFWLDWRLGLFMLAGLVFPLAAVLLLNRPLSTLTRRQRSQKSKLLAFASSRLQAIHTVQFFNKETPELARFMQKTDTALAAGVEYQKMVSLINALIPGMLHLLLAAVFAFIFLFQNESGAKSGGNVLVFIILLMTIMPVFRRMLKVSVVWELGNISFEKLLNVLARSRPDNGNLPGFKYKKGRVKIRNLSYGFHSKDDLFKRLSLNLPGKKLSIVKSGPGTGKSSLIKLLAGLYLPKEGWIKIDGQKLTEVDGKSLRRKITVVSDEIPLLGNTVFEAISYSRRPEKRQPARFILDYFQQNNPGLPPLRLDEPIGERGCQLAKGQRKMLGFARAFLTGKPIVLIDEPFEGLPPRSFPFWAAEIQNLAKNKTVVLFTSHDIEQLFPEATIVGLGVENSLPPGSEQQAEQYN